MASHPHLGPRPRGSRVGTPGRTGRSAQARSAARVCWGGDEGVPECVCTAAYIEVSGVRHGPLSLPGHEWKGESVATVAKGARMNDTTVSGSGAASAEETKPTAAESLATALKDLPASELKPVSGAVSVDGDADAHLADLVTYSGLDNAVSAVGRIMRELKPTGVLIVEDRALLHSSWSYQWISAELGRHADLLARAQEALEEGERSVHEEYQRTAVAPVVGAVIGAVPKVVGAVADVVGMFRTNYTLAGRVMTPEGTPLVAEVARALRLAEVPTVAVDGFRTASGSALLDQLVAAQRARWELGAAAVDVRARVDRRQAELKRLEAELAATLASCLKVAEQDKSTAALDERLAKVRASVASSELAVAPDARLVAWVDGVIAAFDAFLVEIGTVRDGGQPGLVAALLREQLFVEPGISHVLFVSIDYAGSLTASHETRLGPKDKVTWVGGLQLSHLALDVRKGTLVSSGTTQVVSRVAYNVETGELDGHNTAELGWGRQD